MESCTDFFVASARAAAMLDAVELERDTAMAPHHAGGARFVREPTKQVVTVQAMPTRIPTRRVYGPLPRPRARPPSRG